MGAFESERLACRVGAVSGLMCWDADGQEGVHLCVCVCECVCLCVCVLECVFHFLFGYYCLFMVDCALIARFVGKGPHEKSPLLGIHAVADSSADVQKQKALSVEVGFFV